jgi:hypothetical protein
MDSIKYSAEDKTITVMMVDGSSKTYSDRSSYLADWPDREADCAAIGWA